MTLLSILDFGIGWLALLTVVVLGLAGWFFYQAYVASKSGSEYQRKKGNVSAGDMPIYKVNLFWFGVVVVAAYIGILLWIRSDYAPAKPYTPEKIEDGRVPAEDMLPK